MAYQVLARKWRPQDFATLIGQAPVVTALRNALQEGRIAQAYLFAGIRGVGKTTVARVFAKALNCERGAANGPCNECLHCREITAGADLDVLEIDAATYSKVEQIRELTESLRYGPSRDRFKVVVLDEVHRLSRQAFDALLKIVEEPPPHLVFIFATTEIDAVPATILSRCQEFHFRRVSAQEVADHLASLCRQEEIEASPVALRLIARAGEGSVRDAVALLDQLATFGGKKITDEEAARLLGGLDTALFHRLLTAIVDGAPEAVLGASARVTDEGWDPRQVYAHFLAYCRDAVRLALGTHAEEIDLPLDESQQLATLARRAGYENLLRLLHLLIQSEPTVRRSDSGSLACEVTWLRAAELPKLIDLEDLLSGRTTGAHRASPPIARPAVLEGTTEPPPSAPRALPPPPTSTQAPVVAPRSAPEAPKSAPADDLGVRRFLEELSKRRPSLAAQVESASHLRLDGRTLVLSVEPGENLIVAGLNRDANRRLLDEAATAVWGEGAAWRVETAASTPGAARRPSNPGGLGAPPTPTPDLAQAAQHPAVQAVLEIFGGRVANIDGDEPSEGPR